MMRAQRPLRFVRAQHEIVRYGEGSKPTCGVAAPGYWDTASGLRSQLTPASPISTFMQSAAKVLLRARELS